MRRPQYVQEHAAEPLAEAEYAPPSRPRYDRENVALSRRNSYAQEYAMAPPPAPRLGGDEVAAEYMKVPTASRSRYEPAEAPPERDYAERDYAGRDGREEPPLTAGARPYDRRPPADRAGLKGGERGAGGDPAPVRFSRDVDPTDRRPVNDIDRPMVRHQEKRRSRMEWTLVACASQLFVNLLMCAILSSAVVYISIFFENDARNVFKIYSEPRVVRD